MSTHPHPNASALRRSAAMIYDFFLVVAIWILTTIVVIAFLTDGDTVTGVPFQLMLLGEIFVFYAYFWKIKGQTLGMQVWKIRAENEQGETLTFLDSLLRFGFATITMAPLGLGFFWMIVDKQRLTLYDRLSKTRVVYTGNKPLAAEQVDEVS